MDQGKAVRARRRALRLTIAEIAERTGFSVSYVSQVERGVANPSVSALKKIANVLDVPIAYFFEPIREEQVELLTVEPESPRDAQTNPEIAVVRASAHRALTYGSNNVRTELLSPDLNRRMQFMWISMPPGTVNAEEPYCHDGEECSVVLKGKAEVWVDGNRYELGVGDAIYYPSSAPHRWCSIGDEELVIVAANTPPTF